MKRIWFIFFTIQNNFFWSQTVVHKFIIRFINVRDCIALCNIKIVLRGYVKTTLQQRRKRTKRDRCMIGDNLALYLFAFWITGIFFFFFYGYFLDRVGVKKKT